MSEDKWMQTVAALLRKAEDKAATPEESETYFAKAQALITKHALDELAVRAAAGGDSIRDEPIETEMVPCAAGVYYSSDQLLWTVVAKANSCRAVGYKRDKAIMLIGRVSDRENVKLLTTSLLVEVIRRTRELPRDLRDGTVWEKEVYRRSFRTAFAIRIGERIEEAKAQTVAEYDGTLLPAIIEQDQASEDYMRDVVGVRIVALGRGRSDRRGRQAGRAAADRADVGGVRVGAPIAGELT